MSGPIDEAPTPQNTPANAQSYMHKAQNASIPSTIAELVENPSELMSNPLLQSMIQDKLQTLIGEDSGYISNLPINLKNRIYALKALQQDQFKLEAEFQMKLLELERSFADKFGVVNNKRRQLVVGEAEASKDAIALGKELLEEDDEQEDEENDNDSNGIKGIPGFWLTALQNVPLINNMITDRDFDVLDTLIDVRLQYLETPGYKLVFEFEDNDFFKNKVLEKTYYYQKELGYTGEFVYDHSEGCEIDWKSNDVNVTIEIEQRKQRNKHTKQVRIIEKTTHVESFFNFFKPPQLPEKKSEQEEKGEDEEEEDADDIDDELAQSLQMDYLLGELIKDKLIPRAIDCFTGEATNNGLFDMEEDEEEEEFEGEFDEADEDDEEDEDEEDEDEEGEEEGDGIEHKPHQQQECKQQ